MKMKPAICKKCGEMFSGQEAISGFTVCEHCDVNGTEQTLTKAEFSIVREAVLYYRDDATNIDGNSQGQHGKKKSLLTSALVKIKEMSL